MQNQFSPAFRSSEWELRLCQEMGIAFPATDRELTDDQVALLDGAASGR